MKKANEAIFFVVTLAIILIGCIAALILSVGMGVDTNVLLAERIREELKSGKPLDIALQLGFKRAFSAAYTDWQQGRSGYWRCCTI